MILTSHWDNLENMIIDQNEALFLTLSQNTKDTALSRHCLAKDFSSWDFLEETGLGQ